MNKPTTIQTSAFTLAEVMIVLAIIGILIAILLPVAYNATPNENVMKFKKAHNALYTGIRELVNSDKYYLDGNLGIKADGTLIDDNDENQKKYFCQTLADVLAVKNVNCSIYGGHGQYLGIDVRNESYDITVDSINAGKNRADEACDVVAPFVGDEIVLDNNITIYQAIPGTTFGCIYEVTGKQYFFDAHLDNAGFQSLYKPICIDIDGVNDPKQPFGYGIRADGKILNGTRADE